MSNSPEIEVMTRLSNMISYIKSQISSDLMQAKSKGLIETELKDLQKLDRIVQESIQNSFIRSSDEVMSYASYLKEK